MAIVSKPDKDNNVTLYDVPDAELEKYKIPADKLAEMFPKKENRTRDDAQFVAKAWSDPHGPDGRPLTNNGDVEAY
ncbi:MAG TPA: hypothetical protein VGX92_02650 [Pyrinomonadaceae bacterium]|jgi:hypothetical protein|nr:hypothetical protein [Pyrinomonadaceae bacterium]